MYKRAYILSVATAVLLMAYSCHQEQVPAAQRPENTFTVSGSTREIMIWPETVDFPEHEGKAEFTSYCAICHSLRYITIQPDFPRSVWEAEVAKMVTKFKAPIDSVNSKKIVDYLVAIKSPK